MKRLFMLMPALLLTACSIHSYRMNELDSRLELTLADLDISEPLTAEATVVRYLGIDFQRLFTQETGAIRPSTTSTTRPSLSSTSKSTVATTINGLGTVVVETVNNLVSTVVGPIIGDAAGTYALHNLMNANPGYDIILYPKFEKVSRGYPPFYTTTTVKVTARLGRLRGM